MLPTLDLPPPLFGFRLQVVELLDAIPVTPTRPSPVSTFPNIITSAGVQAWTADFQVNTNYPVSVPVAIAIVREAAGRTILGSIERIQNGWYWVGGGQRIPLAANDPCVTRVWPGSRSMSDQDYGRFCRTRVIPGVYRTDWTFNLSYDLATEQISGDGNGPAGTVLKLQHDHIDLRFVVKALDARSFQRDILPLFRPSDVRAMEDPLGPPATINLWSYQDVKANAQSINIALNASTTGQATHMPCDGLWPSGPLLVFQQWIEQGMLP